MIARLRRYSNTVYWLIYLTVLCVQLCKGVNLKDDSDWLANPRPSRIRSALHVGDEHSVVVHKEKSIVLKQITEIRSKRQAQLPVIHGDYAFSDLNRYARIYYSGDSSPVIIVLTYSLRSGSSVTSSNLYRSVNYGESFEQIDNRLDSTVSGGPTLWYNFHVGNVDKNLVVFSHASQPKLFYSTDEGSTWQSQTFSISTIDARTLVWNTKHDNWALAHDITNDVLYLTENLGLSWIQLSINVDSPLDYQWGDPKYFQESSVFYNTFDPADKQRGNYTVGLFYQTYPYNNAKEVDPNLGRHDGFLMVGPYIFAQKSDANNVISLYISYKESPFNKAKIPAEDPHQRYYVAHINELQALVIVEHDSGHDNLYLSDETGVYFSLSLPNIVVEPGNGIDLEVINGVNGTLVANQYVSLDSDTKRTVITLDNGGNWELVVPPDRFSNGSLVNCDPPQCSLHLHMTTSDYARLGVYSQDSAPGLIIAHGTTGTRLADNPNLYLSRDGGVTWEHTLDGSWGVTVADHGGLMVAARDYHKEPSTELMYTCSEGQSWTGFTFSDEEMTVYGVITEPGEYTTTVSLYGVKQSNRVWNVVTVNFSSVFDRDCVATDFYNWQPWDERTDTDCILGADVSIERRNPDTCCLIGPGYVRTVVVTTCECTDEDYDCDYGYRHSDGFVGTCIRDPEVTLPDPCLSGTVLSYNKSTGYRKIPGDVCVNGLESVFEPHPFLCCELPTGQPPSTKGTTSTMSRPTTGDKPISTSSAPTKPPVTTIRRSTSTTAGGEPTQDHSTGHEQQPTGTTGDLAALNSRYLVSLTALGVLLALAIVLSVVLATVAVVFIKKHSKARQQYLRLATSGDGMGGGAITFIRDSGQGGLSHGNDSDEDSDEEPLKL